MFATNWSRAKPRSMESIGYSHLNKLNGMVAKLATYGKNLSHEEKMAMLARSLSDSFASITITLSSIGIDLTPFLEPIRS